MPTADAAASTDDRGPHGGRGVIVGLMNPLPFDDALLWDAVRRHSAVPCQARAIGYEEGRTLHVAKTNGQTAAQVGHLEPPLTPAQLQALTDIDVIIALDLPFAIHRHAPRLAWVQAAGAGVTQLANVLADTSVELASAAGIGAPGIAEFVMSRILQVWKRLRLLDDQQRAHHWEWQFGSRVAGRTMGIVGLGAIGVELARRAAAFDMEVIATRRRPEAGAPDSVARLSGPAGLATLLAESDVVVVAASLNRDTEELIGRSELALMRPGAILCNVSRGMMLDEKAVAEALRSGHLGAAILDTARTEPLPASDPLWDAPNLYLSPHTSNSMDGYADRLGALVAENIERHANGLPLRNRIDIRGHDTVPGRNTPRP
jgi:phosphoglycerate dehydrogenase-like enzyme